MMINYLLQISTLPLFVLQVSFIERSISKKMYYFLIPGMIALMISFVYDFISRELEFTIKLCSVKFKKRYDVLEAKKNIIFKVITAYFMLKTPTQL